MDVFADDHHQDPSELIQRDDLEMHMDEWLATLGGCEREVIMRRLVEANGISQQDAMEEN